MRAALVVTIALGACSAGQSRPAEVPRGQAFTVIPVGDAGTRYIIDPQSQSCFIILGIDYMAAGAPESPQPIDCAALAKNVPVAKETITWSTERPVVAQAAPEPPAPPAVPEAIDEFITRIDDTHYIVDRKLIDEMSANPAKTARGARIVPSIKNGKPNGFKLYAIRPSSVFAKLGLKNGDTVQRFNQVDLTSMDKAMEAYLQLGKLEDGEVTVDLLRRRTPITIHYRLR